MLIYEEFLRMMLKLIFFLEKSKNMNYYAAGRSLYFADNILAASAVWNVAFRHFEL